MTLCMLRHECWLLQVHTDTPLIRSQTQRTNKTNEPNKFNKKIKIRRESNK